MWNKSLRRIMEKWGMNHTKFADMVGSNRGKIASYVLKEGASKPNVEVMLALQKLCGYQVTIRQLWENDFEEDELPPMPILDARPPIKGEEQGTDLLQAFKVIGASLNRMQDDINHLKSQQDDISSSAQ